MPRTILKISLWYLLIDIIIIISCTFIPYIFRHNAVSAGQLIYFIYNWQELNLPQLQVYSLSFIVWGMAIIFTLVYYNLYETNREFTIPKETWLVFKSVIFSAIPIAVTVLLLKVDVFSRLVFIHAVVAMILALSTWRAIKRLLVRKMVASGYNNLNVLIIGAGKIGRGIAEEIHRRPYLGLKICGFLDDLKPKGEEVNGSEVLGRISDFSSVARRKFIDEIYITIPSQRHIVSELVLKGKNLGVGVKIVPDLYDIALGELRTHQLGFLPLLEYHNKGIHGTDLFIKRSMDIIVPLILLLILLPVFIFVAIFIKLDSPGPVFYVSTRCGRKGKPFKFYKFRSMQNEADKQKKELLAKNEKDGPIFKIRNDPRITKFGRFIRKYSLDELPQLWNVLKGDMSLVGPRPPTPDEIVKYTDLQLRRLEIRPGITCLWQIRGRSELNFSKWVELDVWYIDHWSFWLDIKILFWTIPAVVNARGAY